MKKIILVTLYFALGINFLYSQRIVKIGAFNFYPAIFKDNNDEIKGFYVEAFREIELKENLKFEYVFGTWNEGLELLKNDKIDIMVSVAYTDERAQYMDYSTNALLTVWGDVYVTKSSEIDGILSLAGKTIAIMKSDVNGKQLKLLTEKLSVNCTFVEKKDFQSVFESIVSKEVDAGVVNNTYGAGKSEEYNLRSTGIVFNPFDIYLTVHKNKNEEILKLFDKYLNEWRHNINSTYNVSRQKWSHEKVGVIQIIPPWLKFLLFAIVGISIVLTVFIVLLRYKVRKVTIKIKKSEEIFKTFMEHSTAYVYIKDESLKHIYSNQKVKEIDKKTSLNDFESASTIFDPETVKKLEDADRKILNFETKQLSLIYSFQLDNTIRWLHDYKFLLQLPNEKAKVGGVALDITKLKEAEEELLLANKIVEQHKLDLQIKNEEYESINEELSETNQLLLLAKEKAEESDRLKTAFLQNMSHEIRTPLNAISGFSGMLNKPELSEEKRKSFVSIIQNSSNQLVSIVSDILTISSLETKQEKLNVEKVCINNIIVDLLAIFKQHAQNQNISLYAKQHLSNSQSEIYSDKTKITQILTNLLTNALKFTHKGVIEFGYTLRQAQGSVGELVEPIEMEFYVKDTGIGINPEFHDKIFERFRQADKSINKLYGGTGLGLSISKAFAELLGGKIWVHSEFEKGSTFYFTIPYKPVNEIDRTSLPTKQNDNFKTILVAEDEEYNFLFIEELLIDMELKLIHTKDGKETIDIFKANPKIDLILMDIKMPVMTGYEAAKIIKELKPDLPIVAQSAYALDHERAKFEGIFDDYLTKPINEKKLKQMVMKYINL